MAFLCAISRVKSGLARLVLALDQDCKSPGSAFEGSNPSPATSKGSDE